MVYHEISQKKDIVLCSEEFFQWIMDVLRLARHKQRKSSSTMDYTIIMRSEVKDIPDRRGKSKLPRNKADMDSPIYTWSGKRRRKDDEDRKCHGKNRHLKEEMASSNELQSIIKKDKCREIHNMHRCKRPDGRNSHGTDQKRNNDIDAVYIRKETRMATMSRLAHRKDKSKGNSIDTLQSQVDKSKYTEECASDMKIKSSYVSNPAVETPKKGNDNKAEEENINEVGHVAPDKRTNTKFPQEGSATKESKSDSGYGNNSCSAYPFIWNTNEDEHSDPIKVVTNIRNNLAKFKNDIVSPLKREETCVRRINGTDHDNKSISVEGQEKSSQYLDMPNFDDLFDDWIEEARNQQPKYHNFLAIGDGQVDNYFMEGMDSEFNIIGQKKNPEGTSSAHALESISSISYGDLTGKGQNTATNEKRPGEKAIGKEIFGDTSYSIVHTM